jgi:RND family efflux transporter MFP subunit
VARVVRSNLDRKLELAAYFRPYLEVDLHAKVAGYLRHIGVDIGDRVKTGQLLATLEIPELQDELGQAAAEIRRDQAEVSRAREDLQRARSAYTATHENYLRLSEVSRKRPKLIAQQELDDAQAKDLGNAAKVSAAQDALDAASHEVQVAVAGQDKLRTMLSYTRITAPFSGVITKRYADPGAMIQAGTASQSQALPLVHLAMDRVLRMIVPVPEDVVPQVHLGEPVAVRVPALNRTFQGEVSRFTGDISSATRTMDTEVDLDNRNRELKPGMYAYATFTLETRSNALAVPLEAVAGLDAGSPWVMVVGAGSRLERRNIRAGLQTANRVEVLGGLKQGEMVVVGSPTQFYPGELVEPKPVQLAEAKQGNR